MRNTAIIMSYNTLFFSVVIMSILFLQIVRGASSDCGDSIEGDDDIAKLYLYNTTSMDNSLMTFPDVIFSYFLDKSVMHNNVCSSIVPTSNPAFSTATYEQQFNYSCIIVDTEAFVEYFLEPIVINLGKPTNCNCTINPIANDTDSIYATAVTIIISGQYTNGWLDYDWVLMGCEVLVNRSAVPPQENDMFQQIIIAQSHYIPTNFAISFWVVLGIMMGGAALVVSISALFVSQKKDKEFFFNNIGGSFSMKPRQRHIADLMHI